MAAATPVSRPLSPALGALIEGVDLSAPMAVFVGLSGNAPTVFGGNQGNGNYAIGIGADVYQKYRFDLKEPIYDGNGVPQAGFSDD